MTLAYLDQALLNVFSKSCFVFVVAFVKKWIDRAFDNIKQKFTIINLSNMVDASLYL